MVNTDRLVNNFKELGLIDGIHGKEYEIAQELMQRLKQLGVASYMDEAGNSFGGNSGNIRAKINGNKKFPSIFLCSHLDTIQPTKHLNHVHENGMIKTDGTTILGGDDRAGVAVILEILHLLKEQSLEHGTIEILFTVCEEAGMYGAKFVERSEFEAEYGFVFDCQASPGNYIVEAPGAYSFTAVVKGCSAHAAVSPEKGIHAIQIASNAISRLKLGRWAETGMINVGTIHGGTSINIIPDQVEITGETRNANEDELMSQIAYIKSTFETAAKEMGGSVEIIFTEKYPGYQFVGNEVVLDVVRRGISKAGFEPIDIKYPGGSDANILNKKGLTTVNLGVGFKNAHSFQECIAVEDLVAAATIGFNIVKHCFTDNK